MRAEAFRRFHAGSLRLVHALPANCSRAARLILPNSHDRADPSSENSVCMTLQTFSRLDVQSAIRATVRQPISAVSVRAEPRERRADPADDAGNDRNPYAARRILAGRRHGCELAEAYTQKQHPHRAQHLGKSTWRTCNHESIRLRNVFRGCGVCLTLLSDSAGTVPEHRPQPPCRLNKGFPPLRREVVKVFIRHIDAAPSAKSPFLL
jgi:hypothetical protein